MRSMRMKRKFGLVIYALPTFVFILLLLLEMNYVKNYLKTDSLSYNEKGDISYKVFLKDNDYYETNFLDENSSYIASLIDNFNINYSYINTLSDDVEYSVKYDITADLEVYDTDNKAKPIYTKNYKLLDEQEKAGKGKLIKIDMINQVIKYDDYNKIIDDLKKEIIPDAKLIVNFNTRLIATNDKIDKEIKSNYTSKLSIPISQKTINVDLIKDTNNNMKVVKNDKKISKPILFMIGSTLFLIVLSSVLYVMYVFKNNEKKSKYEQKVKKILREYDRAITEAKGKLKLDDNCNKIEVKNFEELLDVHDNFNIPIIFYKINDKKCVFVVKNNNDIYYCNLKSEDFE